MVYPAHTLKVAFLAWEVSPGTTARELEQSLETLYAQTSCRRCERSLQDYIAGIVERWTETKLTI